MLRIEVFLIQPFSTVLPWIESNHIENILNDVLNKIQPYNVQNENGVTKCYLLWLSDKLL